ncbi:MAG: hypothetical protein QM704_11425 [Anaeromyxobacteraceae bacterium]
MDDIMARNPGRRLGVWAIPKDEDKTNGKGFWTRIGVAFTNRDGSLSILLDSLPLGTNKLQVREIKEDAARGVPGARARQEEPFEEVRT